ncbi:MAG: hypothetical protein D6696_07960 [Acidobacteria bacterium]|nr:MAG: hypothetical protein D6696_07960 [Acidobacteriota bacterium]
MNRVAVQYAQLLLVAAGMMASQLLLKKGMAVAGPLGFSPRLLGELVWRILTTPQLILGYLIGGLTTLVWLVVLSRLELSHALPTLTAIYFILVVLASRFVLHEQVSVWRWAGTLVLILGIALIARDG